LNQLLSSTRVKTLTQHENLLENIALFIKQISLLFLLLDIDKMV